MQIEIYNDIVAYLTSLLAPFGLGFLAPFLAIGPILVILYVIYLVIVRFVKSSFRKLRMPPEAMGGIIFIIRLIFLAVAMVLILTLTSPILEGEVIITAGALLGTALGLAFSRSLSNLVGGLFILGARPFRVGDYIKVGDDEGIVLEVTLNYTALLLQDYSQVNVPNIRIIDSKVINCRTTVHEYLQERKHDPNYQPLFKMKEESRIKHLDDIFRGKEFYRYTFLVVIPQKYEMSQVLEHFELVCAKWNDEFLEQPEFVFWGSNNWGNKTYRFAINLSDPYEIYTKGTAFQVEINDIHSSR